MFPKIGRSAHLASPTWHRSHQRPSVGFMRDTDHTDSHYDRQDEERKLRTLAIRQARTERKGAR